LQSGRRWLTGAAINVDPAGRAPRVKLAGPIERRFRMTGTCRAVA